MRGTDVLVVRGTLSGVDGHGNEVKNEVLERVSDVLVHPVSGTKDVTDREAEQSGSEIHINLAFPKTYNKPMRGCRVVIPCLHQSREWVVVGDPHPIPHNCPTRWNYLVEAVFNDG